jgi:hypothetical protein
MLWLFYKENKFCTLNLLQEKVTLMATSRLQNKESIEQYYERCSVEIKEDIAKRDNSPEAIWKVRRLAMFAINYLGIREEV